MQKSQLFFKIALFAIISAALYSCTKKVSGINNNQVIETPFSLFFSDTAGGLYSSNDGKNIRQTLFKADGYPSKAICVSGESILWEKNYSLLISTNNGVNFNHSFDSAGVFPGYACNGFPVDLNQSMMINIPAWNRVYTVSSQPWPLNYLGINYSLQQGVQGSWYTEGRPDTNGNCGVYTDPNPLLQITITSLTQLTNGVLCGYDGRHNREFYKTPDILWKECTANIYAGTATTPANIGSEFNQTGIPLPHHDTFATPSDMTARYSYGHYNNRLIAIDNFNCNSNGAYYSDDTGRNWYQYHGLPGVPLLCVASPFEEVSLIGTDGGGLYKLNNDINAWQICNSGLGTNLIVRNIAFKENNYKDGSTQKYVFIATNQGIYTSTDMGANWTLTIPGNFVTIY